MNYMNQYAKGKGSHGGASGVELLAMGSQDGADSGSSTDTSPDATSLADAGWKPQHPNMSNDEYKQQYSGDWASSYAGDWKPKSSGNGQKSNQQYQAQYASKFSDQYAGDWKPKENDNNNNKSNDEYR